MKYSMMFITFAVALILSVFSLSPVASALDGAAICNADCSDNCTIGHAPRYPCGSCSWRGCKWKTCGGEGIVEPICKASCEAGKYGICEIFDGNVGALGAAAYVAMCAELGHRGPQHTPLDSFERQAFRPEYGDIVDQVQIHYGVGLGYKFDLGIVGKYDVGDASAKTCGYDIYVEDQFKDFDEVTRFTLIAHEMRHSLQYKGSGESLGQFGRRYITYFAKAGFNYRSNEWERDAYDHEEAAGAAALARYEGLITAGVSKRFQEITGRLPTFEELRVVVATAKVHGDIDTAIKQEDMLLASHVVAIYQDLLGREPDSSELADGKTAYVATGAQQLKSDLADRYFRYVYIKALSQPPRTQDVYEGVSLVLTHRRDLVDTDLQCLVTLRNIDQWLLAWTVRNAAAAAAISSDLAMDDTANLMAQGSTRQANGALVDAQLEAMRAQLQALAP